MQLRHENNAYIPYFGHFSTFTPERIKAKEVLVLAHERCVFVPFQFGLKVLKEFFMF